MYNNVYEAFIRAFSKIDLVAQKHNYRSSIPALKVAYWKGNISKGELERALELRLKLNEIKHTDASPLITQEDAMFISELELKLRKCISDNIEAGGKR